MSEHVTGLNRDQTALFPDTLEGYVYKDNPARFIDAFIDSLTMIIEEKVVRLLKQNDAACVDAVFDA